MSSDQEARITELEIRLTHQDRLLEELNGVVIEQQNQLELLKEQVEVLTTRLVESAPDGDTPPEDQFSR
ncbi:MAG: SlyX family protein [Bradymonadia bacterium]